MPAIRLSLPALAALALLGACTAGPEVGVDDWTVAIEQELRDEGIDDDVIECVLRIGRADLERGPLGEVALSELLLGCDQARAVLDGATGDAGPDIELALVDLPWVFGDDPDLDRLWTACEEGSGAACDELFRAAPVGSEYERFGVSCGDRPDLLHCNELDEDAPPPASASQDGR